HAAELREGRLRALHRLVRRAPEGGHPMRRRAARALLPLLLALPPVMAALSAERSLPADISFKPDTPEAGSVEAVARFATEPRFLSPWVAYVPASDAVPSPAKHLGHLVGAPGELTHAGTIQSYVRALAKASPRVRVETIGRTEEGRDIVLVAIADEAGIK